MTDKLGEIAKLHRPQLRATRFQKVFFSIKPVRCCIECNEVWPCKTSQIIASS
jgi:hypothetical protein